ncbi:MAG: aldo/keto reductase [Bacteroidota bacterium]|nr:aldo/keto reductase [Bacteroidota bacterium]MDP4246953.1 aldo/keto reductase [Bacteroidota bacterium]MDP4255299.1 aldo/keto reductase [Bacteroidota bacterium]MDP4260537.1 aldo/keto reductase [Bacteroidota bacterium]
MTKRKLGKDGPDVSAIGLGCMRMSAAFGGQAKDEAESIATIRSALDRGINFLNTADFYGSGHNELLVGRAIKGRRDEAVISVKFGALMAPGGGFRGFDLRPASIKNFITYSLVRLSVETIDIYQPGRLDPSVPLEEVVGTIADLIKEGKVRYLGLSEVSSEPLRKAHSICPVTALEVEYSLAKRMIEPELLPTARELGIGIVAFGNTAQGLLTGHVNAPLEPGDMRNRLPRFQGENLSSNLEKVEVLKTMARDKGYSPAQLAIAWVHAQGNDIMPLVGMSQPSRLAENLQALEITFTNEELARLHTTFALGAIRGESYPPPPGHASK